MEVNITIKLNGFSCQTKSTLPELAREAPERPVLYTNRIDTSGRPIPEITPVPGLHVSVEELFRDHVMIDSNGYFIGHIGKGYYNVLDEHWRKYCSQ